MNRPIYEDDLTTLDARHADPLMRLRDVAASAVCNLTVAVTEETMKAAVILLNDIGDVVGDMLPNGEITDQDLPFGQARGRKPNWVGYAGENMRLGSQHSQRNCFSFAFARKSYEFSTYSRYRGLSGIPVGTYVPLFPKVFSHNRFPRTVVPWVWTVM